jgi:methionyl aminopeptidase
MEITRKSAAEVAKMRSAGRIVAEVLALVEESLAPGISTADIDRLAERHIRASGGVPSFLGYLGGRRYDASHPHAYKASTCISIDHEIVHGIPGNREIKRGQVVSVDVGAIYDGWNGDGARTFICGGREAGTPEALALIDTTRLSLMAGIAAAQPGNRVGDIGAAVEAIGRQGGYGIVRGYGGHGIGEMMHEDPSVLNFATDYPDARVKLEPGMCLAIEPMFMVGGEKTKTLKDGWTVVTADRSLAAHFEHTITIHPEGPEILTKV